jgi:hypothetical protein
MEIGLPIIFGKEERGGLPMIEIVVPTDGGWWDGLSPVIRRWAEPGEACPERR